MTNQRRNVTQPADWWDAFKAAADKQGLSLSEWIGDCCKQQLPAKVAAKLSDRQPAHRPAKKSD